ncbi:succinate semialdehyde dehydrogenase [Auriculariales sp. MPI-PUGE-AT-0066]|nr:succinate semialdehyde dehydrogenase [Auriculariales sp. MPI-PUGE-AT-0066]
MSQTTIIPHSQEPLVTRNYPPPDELDARIAAAKDAQTKWKAIPLSERISIGRRFIDEFNKFSDEIPLELSLQMGRPITQNGGEVRGMISRAEFMLDIATAALAEVELKETDKPGFRRFIRREPLGVVLVIAPWNYPYLTMINSVLPAIVAGNAVLLKPSPQTPLAAERLAQAFTNAGLPKDVLQVLHLSPELTELAVKSKKVSFVSFTGSVAGGQAVERAAAATGAFKGVGLELGGKDPAYVREDADLDYTVPELVEGAFYNSGQSCCAIERIYVHERLYDAFVSKYVPLVKNFKLGDPTDKAVDLGPVVSLASAKRIRKQIADAVAAGAKPLVDEQLFPIAKDGTAYVAPQVLVEVDHTMEVMMEESFGPVIGIMKVSGDEEALKLMNDSPYGLTASVWTNAAANKESEAAFERLASELEAGTVFLNRCDFLDPALAWTGVKNSGRGISLSKYGYDQLTRAKSIHMKIKTS